ncbi:MAG: VOC family protein [Burkholderiales bacterium]|nr:VOC family protein [Burkholderiales bacterium]
MTVPTIDHVGIVVQALEPAVETLRRLLPGAALVRRSLPAVGLEVAEFQAANISIELLQYTGPADDLAHRAMGAEPGLNHLSIAVRNLDDALNGLAAQGVAPIEGFPCRGSHGRIAFLPPDACSALRIELCQPDEPAGVQHD